MRFGFRDVVQKRLDKKQYVVDVRIELKTYITVIQRIPITNQLHVRCTFWAMVYFTLIKIVFEKEH